MVGWPRFAPSVAVAALLSKTAASFATPAPIAVPERERVLVPADVGAIGVTKAEVAALVTQCVRSLPNMPIVSSFGRVITFADLCEAWGAMHRNMSARPVMVSSFWIGRFEVTQGQYQRCVDAGPCSASHGSRTSSTEALPVVNVTAPQAQAYCQWRGGRLPTEFEWERAARGVGPRGAHAQMPWGAWRADPDWTRHVARRANLGRARNAAERTLEATRDHCSDCDWWFSSDADGVHGLAPPGTYPLGRGPYGTYDQAGNVAEWTLAHYDEAGYDSDAMPAAGPGAGLTTASPQVLAASGAGFVARGGSWRTPPLLAQVFARDMRPLLLRNQADTYDETIGFRCVWPADGQ